MFQNMAEKKKVNGDVSGKTKKALGGSGSGGELAPADLPDIDEVLKKGSGGGGGGPKKLSVERIYQKKTQHEHILLRPDTYIGSVEKVTMVRLLKLLFACLFETSH